MDDAQTMTGAPGPEPMRTDAAGPGPCGWVWTLADSELAGLDRTPHGLTLRLAAARLRWQHEGRLIEGFCRGLRLHLAEVDTPAGGTGIAGTDSPPAGRILEGRLWHSGTWHGSLPVPARLDGPLRLDLRLPHGDALQLQARAAELAFEGEPRCQESMAC